jgi:N-acetylneuraminic acid mutarotase
MVNTLKSYRMTVSCAAVMLLTACGGGSSGGSPSVTTYAVSATAGTGGTISPAGATVNAGGTTNFTVTPSSGYAISGVTGCGGTLAGATYTTGAVNANCTVTANFSAAFTWVGGSSTTGASGVYGVRGVAASSNIPGARDGGVTWTDANDNLWLFGGFAGYVHNTTAGDFLNDLWEYSPASGEWTWVSGSNTLGAQGNYGAKGVPAATNVPGARSNEISWRDASGNLWLFGGGGTDSTGGFIFLNDLWEYSPASGEWTWIGGSSTGNAAGIYGAKGQASATNMPGARTLDGTVWTDASGNVWLFGGYGYDSNGHLGHLNDLWEYSASSNEWTWVGGSNTTDASGVYGTQGMAATTNIPGARNIPVTWMDASGNLWLFGGYGYDSVGTLGPLNDLWEYSPSNDEWTWVGGASTANAKGVYGTEGTAAAGNIPGARNQAVAWTDSFGNVWLFGGYGLDSAGAYDFLNDLWKYSPSSREWTWVGGSNTVDASGVYGTGGVAAATNMPGARAVPFRWGDSHGNLWLFGGFEGAATPQRVEMNDLWKYPTQ